MPDDFTGLLRAWSRGDRGAQSRIWPEIYPELKIIAKSVLKRFRDARAPSTTSLVHESVLRMLDIEIAWADRRHFYAASAKAMRYVAVDAARRRMARKRGGDHRVESEGLDQVADRKERDPEEILAIHQALERLAKVNERHERLVEMRYFAGMTVQETAEALGVSSPTVVRDWKAARIWLHDRLQGE